MRVRPRSTLRTLAAVLLLALLSWLSGRVADGGLEPAGGFSGPGASTGVESTAPARNAASGGERVARAFAERESGFMVTVEGRVARLLPDDREGSRHQRFLLDLPGGPRVLVAHNIDLAERAPLEPGDRVRLRGQYEWNERGGVLHWTHRDPGRSASRDSTRETARGSTTGTTNGTTHGTTSGATNGHEGGWIEIDGRRIE